MKGGNAPGLNQSTMNFNRKTDGERLRGSCVCSIVVLKLGEDQGISVGHAAVRKSANWSK